MIYFPPARNAEEQAFFNAIAATPDDDTPRLAYADWLDDQPAYKTCGACEGKGTYLGASPDRGNPTCSHCNGDGRVQTSDAARAQFIRVQCCKPIDGPEQVF